MTEQSFTLASISLQCKMENYLNDELESSLRTLLEVTEKSGNLRKDLKDDIRKSVSALRAIYNALSCKLNEKDKRIQDLEKQNSQNQNGSQEGKHSTRKKTYAEVAKSSQQEKVEPKTFKLIVKSRSNHSAEHMKTIIKSKLNPTEMKVGINSFRALRNGNLLIETQNRNEIDIVCVQKY